MKKALSIFLTICLIFTALPMFVMAEQSSEIVLSADVERILYCPTDTVKVNINLTGNTEGVAALRSKLNYDSENLTLTDVVSVANDSFENRVSVTYSDHNGYAQILWDVIDDDTGDFSNYIADGTIATVYFTVNKDAENKDYSFDLEYLDGVRYTYSETTYWEYITEVKVSSDSMTVNTDISSQLYFDDVPTGTYPGESVTLKVALNSEDGLYIFNSKLHYDKNNFTLTDCVTADDSLSLSYNDMDGYVNLLWDSTSVGNFIGEGAVATVTFKVNENAATGTARFELEYVDAVSIDLSNGVSVNNALFNTYHCEFPLLSERVPVAFTLNRGNGATETITLYAGETLSLPDTNFFDKAWYTSPSATVESVYSEEICPENGVTLYSSAYAVDYTDDPISNLCHSSDFAIEKEGETESLYYSSLSADSSTIEMFRLGKVQDNVTYKLSVKYKAELSGELGFNVGAGNGNNMYVNQSIFEGDTNTVIYSATDTDDYKTADIYFTASLKGTVSEQTASDDVKYINGNGWVYILVVGDYNTDNKIWISDISLTEIGNVITPGGASLLIDEAYSAAENKQAIRYYFSYNTVADEQNPNTLRIKIGNENYEIISRGFLYRNGALNKYADDKSVTKEGMNVTAAKGSADIITQAKTSEFNQCWEYNKENGELCFSTYISGYSENMYDYKLMVRGFVTFRDEAGNQFTVYSSTINRSVNGMKGNPVNGIDTL